MWKKNWKVLKTAVLYYVSLINLDAFQIPCLGKKFYFSYLGAFSEVLIEESDVYQYDLVVYWVHIKCFSVYKITLSLSQFEIKV